MASRRSRPRRLLLPTILAAVLAAEITGLTLARTLLPATPPQSPAAVAPAAIPAATTDAVGRPLEAGQADAFTLDPTEPAMTTATPRSDGEALATAHSIGRADSAHAVASSSKARTGAASGSGHGSSAGHAASASHDGRNRVWIPSLGINNGIQSFPCSRSRPPDAGVYRWGCAGGNNVYLLGHAWSTFKPLHDAYISGRLHTGMQVIYADGGGTVHTYSVVWWKVVAPTTAASWAWASLSTPSMTLQTCVGANSQFRLMVRLIQVG